MRHTGIESVKPLINAAYASNTTDINGSAVDTQGFDGVLFLIHVHTVAGGTHVIKAQQDTVSGMGTAADLLGSAQSITAAGLYYIDVNKPGERYVRPVIDKDGSNSVAASITAILYGPRTEPVTQTITGERHVTPAEGTA